MSLKKLSDDLHLANRILRNAYYKFEKNKEKHSVDVENLLDSILKSANIISECLFDKND